MTDNNYPQPSGDPYNASPQQYPGYAPAPQPLGKGLAIAALVLGIFALLFSWIPFLNFFTGIAAVVGLILGIIAIVKAVKGTAGGKVMAIVGTSLAALALILGTVVNTAVVSAIDDATPSSEPAPVVVEETEEVTEAAPGAEEATEESPEPTPEASDEDAEGADDGTVSQQNALGSAEGYLEWTNFSESGLISQLEFEGYSTEDATWAIDRLEVDWDVQAAGAAESYLEFSNFSRSGLIDQLLFDGFTQEQAEYGVAQAGL